MSREGRIFINHPKVGTLITYKSIPLSTRSKKRHRLTEMFYYMVRFEDNLWDKGFEETMCLRCRKLLLNPQSLLLHKGTFCKHKS